MENSKKAILVTGTSSGNGRSIALHLDKLGYKVFATVRNQEDLTKIKAYTSPLLTPLILDITSETSIEEAYYFVSSELKDDEVLYGLVNNAGAILLSPIEVNPIKDIKDLIDLNVVGHIRVTQKFLPLLKESKGKIINISSVAGRISFPLMGIYSATKAALNSISDALRIELAKTGVDVITIEPGAVKTPGWVKAEDKFNELYISKRKIINKFYKPEFKFIRCMLKHQSIIETSSDKVAKQVANALESSYPRFTYRVGFGARWLNFIAKFIALNWGAWLIMRTFKKFKSKN